MYTYNYIEQNWNYSQLKLQFSKQILCNSILGMLFHDKGIQ